MKVTFLSMDEDENKVFFESDASFCEDEIVFADKSLTDTTLYLRFEPDRLNLRREGQVFMRLSFRQHHKTDGFYRDSFGLEIPLTVLCTFLKVEAKKTIVHYELWWDEQMKTKHKILLLFEESIAK